MRVRTRVRVCAGGHAARVCGHVSARTACAEPSGPREEGEPEAQCAVAAGTVFFRARYAAALILLPQDSMPHH
ncbi:hypothetical protein SAMN05216267_106211 [Actinacidiphila rubida]|uniref:Uncharacterized protein n=1 Tax=Actinacidiphila rubida TaxID=310780 RepID=A0A1H8U0W2_9ACTN|nr:hypothetical protein SAMN05216267_106211 [Actinacidiphila rubida]